MLIESNPICHYILFLVPLYFEAVFIVASGYLTNPYAILH